MRNPKRISLFGLTLGVAIALSAFNLTTGYSRTDLTSGPSYESPKPAYHVRTLHAPGLPVRIKGNMVPAGEGGLALKYSIANITQLSVHDLEIAIYLLNKKGRVKAGQVWRLPIEVSANSTEDFSVRLTNMPKLDDSIVVAVQEITQEQRTRRVDTIPFLKMAMASVASTALATARLLRTGRTKPVLVTFAISSLTQQTKPAIRAGVVV